MHVEWQGDHRLLGDDVKQDFERELTRLGLDPSKFLAEVRRELGLPGVDGRDAIRYDVYITDLEHPDRDALRFASYTLNSTSLGPVLKATTMRAFGIFFLSSSAP